MKIARAALELFVTRGFAATKLEDVAKEASVSKGLPYLYFKNKEELFKAVAEVISYVYQKQGKLKGKT